MQYNKSKKEKEVFSYKNSKGEELWMYRHKYYDALTGKRRDKKKHGFKTEKAAIQALIEIKAQTLRGETKSIENDNLTVGQWLDIWFDSNKRKWKPSTIINRELFIRLHFKPLLGSVKLKKLDRYIYEQNFLQALDGKYTPSTIKALHKILCIAINAAIKEEILLRNKILDAALPNNREVVKDNFFSPQELDVFLKILQENEDATHITIFYLLAYTGMRKGEALALTWSCIDFENRKIKITRTRGPNGIGSTKHENSERTIKVDLAIIKQLEAYQKTIKATLFKFGLKLMPDTLIFLSMFTGKPLSPTGVNQNFNAIKRLMGITKCNIHGLRHTHATILLNNGIPVKAIAKRLGNTPAQINDVYGHVLTELEDKTVSVFSESLNTFGAKNGASF